MVSGKQKYHINLSNYFKAQSLFFDGDNQGKPNIRKSMEQPWQQTTGAMEPELLQTLLDISFLEQKARFVNIVSGAGQDKNKIFGGIFSLIEDTIYAIESMNLQPSSANSLRDLLQFLRSESHNISIIPSLLRQQALNCSDDSAVSKAAASQNSTNKLPWFELVNKRDFDSSVVLTIEVSELNLASHCMSSDGSMIIGADKNGCVFLWSGLSGRLIGSFHSEIVPVQNLQLTRDDRFLAVVGDTGAILLDLSKNKTINRFNLRDLMITASAFGETDVALIVGLGYENGTVAIWNVEEKLLITEFHLSNYPIRNLSLVPEEHLLFADTDDRSVYRFDYLNSDVMKLTGFSGTEFFYVSDSISDNDLTVRMMKMSGSSQENILLRNKKTVQSYYSVLKPSKPAALLNIKEKDLLVEASNEGEGILSNKVQVLTFWNTQSGKQVRSINFDFGQITSLSTLPDGKIAAGKADGTVDIRDLSENKVFRLKASSNPVAGISTAPDGLLVIRSSDKIQLLKLFDQNSDRWTKSEPDSAGMTSDGRYLMNDKNTGYSSSASQYLIPFEPVVQYDLDLSEPEVWPVSSISISADESVAFVQKYFYGWNKSHYSAELFDISSGKRIPFTLWPENTNTIFQRIPLNKSYFIASLPGGELCQYKTNDGTVKSRINTPLENISKMVIDPGGNRLVMSDDKGTVIIWDTKINKNYADAGCKSVFKDNSIESISLDGSWILAKSKYFSSTGIDLNKLILCDAEKKQIKELFGLRSLPASVGISPDGSLVASGDQEKRIHIWDVNTARIIATINNVNGYSFCFTSDGNYLVTGGIDSIISLWRISPIEHICQFRALSPIMVAQAKGSYIVAGDKLGKTYILKLKNFHIGQEYCLVANKSGQSCMICGGRIESRKDNLGYCINCNREFRLIKDRFEK